MNKSNLNHWQFPEKSNFLIEKRFVYVDRPKTTPSAPKQKTTTPKSKAKKFTAQNFATYKERYKQHMRALRVTITDKTKLKQRQDTYNKRLAQIKAKYDNQVALLREFDRTNPEKDAANMVKEQVNALITKIRQHLPKGTGEKIDTTLANQPKPTTQPKKTDKLNGKEKILTNLEKAKKGLLNIMKKNWNNLKKAMSNIPGTNILKTTSFEDFKKSPIINKVINYTLKNLDKSQINKLEKGEMPKISVKLTRKAFLVATGMENLNNKNDDEIKIIKKLKLNNKTFEQIFGADSKIPELLSRKYKIKENNGRYTIDDKPVTNINNLKTFLPLSIQRQFDNVVNNPNNDKNKKKLNLRTTVESNILERFNSLTSKKSLEDIIKNTTKENGPDKPAGSMELILLLVQLWQAVKKALKDNDWATVKELMEDGLATKNPRALARKLKASKDAYKEKLEDENYNPSLNLLVLSYLKPRGNEANTLLAGNGSKNTSLPINRYRNEAKPFIKTHIQKRLGPNISIENIEKTKGNLIKITAYDKDGNKISLSIKVGKGEKFAVQINTLTDNYVKDKTNPNSGKRIKEDKLTPFVAGRKDFIKMGNFKELAVTLLTGKAPGTQVDTTSPKPDKAKKKAETPKETPQDKRLKKVAKLTSENLKQFRILIKTNFKREYKKYVTKFKKTKDFTKWTPTLINQCRREFLKTKIKDKKVIDFINEKVRT